MQSEISHETPKSLLAELVGEECCWCTSGTLAREEFKGDEAVVCDECGTPGARVW
ncbi:HVO_A0556 family zinc finger protein [Halorussus ruber]|uniref:HVO_A0556 family zinc finger protein n=1 Tax=Halorussus ruber TaxID=1126238 RepID=UPI00143DF04D|nr:HVO_A0556 family zinc finger protein [Halorussus ruber]